MGAADEAVDVTWLAGLHSGARFFSSVSVAYSNRCTRVKHCEHSRSIANPDVTYKHRVATLVEEARVVLGLAVKSHVPGVIHLVLLEVALIVRGGLLLTRDKVMTMGNHHSGGTGGSGEDNRCEREDVHDESVDGLVG